MKQGKLIFASFILVMLSVSSYGQWNLSVDTDEMTGKTTAYCSSPMTSPTKSMDFPYSDTKAWLGIGCDGNSEWVYIGFTEEPNLNNTVIEDGYNRMSLRVKWDDEIVNERFTQTWGAKFIHFSDGAVAVRNIANSNTLLVELDWYGSGKTYFKFNLAGSSASIAKMRAKCKK